MKVAKNVEDKITKVTLLNRKTHRKKCSQDKMRVVYLKRKIIFQCKKYKKCKGGRKIAKCHNR